MGNVNTRISLCAEPREVENVYITIKNGIKCQWVIRQPVKGELLRNRH